jgi:hypothetical protein
MKERTMRTSLMCFAHGHDGQWEAICVDLDIAVQGTTFSEVQTLLNDAIVGYVEIALDEADEVRERLLSRRAPWHVRVSMAARFVAYTLFHRGKQRELQASFGLQCPA